jgi:hypothetical protein
MTGYASSAIAVYLIKQVRLLQQLTSAPCNNRVPHNARARQPCCSGPRGFLTLVNTRCDNLPVGGTIMIASQREL